MKYTLLAALLLGLALPAVTCAQEAADQAVQLIETTEPTFNGTWIRNADLSDNPAEIMTRRGGQPGGRGGGMKGGGGRGGLGRGGGGRGGSRGVDTMPDGISDAPPGKKRPDMMRGRERLAIFHEDEEFSVTDAMDVMQTVYTDGRRTERWTQLGQMFDTAVPTKDGLMIRSEMSDGNSRSATYTLSDTGDRLTVVHSFKPPKSDKTVHLRMVYDRVE
ncbi:hypothetical protein H8E07_15240 [bacterium]|nr:hypothetical protein [bacterium]